MSESSPEDQSAPAGEENSQDVNTAESSAAEAEGVNGSWIDRVGEILSGQEESPASDEQGSGEPNPKPDASTEGAEEGGDKSEEDEISEDELKKYTPNAQQRIRELVDQKKGVLSERDQFRQEADTLRPKAEHLDKITGYMQQHGIDAQEFDNTLAITGLIKGGRYDDALKAVEPIYQQLKQLAGDVLPADLQEQVRLGYITEDHARQLHKSQTRLSHQERQDSERQEREAAEREQRQLQERVDSAAKTADEWAKAKAGSDPDWSTKQDLVAEQLELELHRLGRDKYPKTRDEVIELSEKALAAVEARLKQFRPQPKQMRAPTGQFASPRSQAKPASYMEAIDQALGAGG